MIPWRLQNDLSLVAFEKTPSTLCQLLRYLAVDQGIGDLEVEDHELAAAMHPVTWRSFIKIVYLSVGSPRD